MINTPGITAGGVAGFAYTFLYLLTAVFAACLVFVSYQFEVGAYTALLGSFGAEKPLPGRDITVAQMLALGLNGGKIVLIFVVVDALRRWRSRTYAAKALRALVLLLSFLMTLLVFGGHTISPRAEAQLDAARDEIQAVYGATLETLEGDHAQQAAGIVTRHQDEVARVHEAHAARLNKLNALLNAERLVGGQSFKGARYIELESLIAAERTEATTRLDDLRAEEQVRLAALAAEFDERRAAARLRAQGALDGLSFSESFASSEAQNPYMLRAAAMVRTFSDAHADPVKVAIFLAAILCFCAELLPIVLFTHLFRALGETLSASSSSATQEGGLPVKEPSNEVTSPAPLRDRLGTGRSENPRHEPRLRRLDLGAGGQRGR